MEITSFCLGDLMTNAYVVSGLEEGQCFVVDMPGQPGELLDYLGEKSLRPQALWLTHAHADHIAGIPPFLARFPGTPVHLHRAEEAFMGDPTLNLSAYFPPGVSIDPADKLYEEGPLQWGSAAGQIFHTPGHSPGSCCFYFPEHKVLLAGDTLFQESVGRTDFPTSNHGDLVKSIHDKLFVLPEETRVFPGHGEPTTIGHEKENNPFV
jgi:hydroxyacylglutathione hydrolase